MPPLWILRLSSPIITDHITVSSAISMTNSIHSSQSSFAFHTKSFLVHPLPLSYDHWGTSAIPVTRRGFEYPDPSHSVCHSCTKVCSTTLKLYWTHSLLFPIVISIFWHKCLECCFLSYPLPVDWCGWFVSLWVIILLVITLLVCLC